MAKETEGDRALKKEIQARIRALKKEAADAKKQAEAARKYLKFRL